MMILLSGAGPRMAAVRALLQQLQVDATVEEAWPSREALNRHSGAPPGLLLLVDPQPFTAMTLDTVVTLGRLDADLLRGEALRAVFALEMAKRATRTLVLEGDAAAWPAVLAENLGATTVTPLLDLPAGPHVEVLEGMAPLLASYLGPIWRAAGAGHAPPIAWSREAFFDGDAPGEPLPAVIEVAGRARIVAYGPYLPVPAGTWRATAWLGFSPDIGRMPFILEVDSGGSVSRGFFEAERGGIFSLDLDFRVADPLHPLELRLITQDSALEGQAALIEVRLDPA